MDNKNNLLEGGRVISATRSDTEFLNAISSAPKVVFDLDPDVMNVSAKVKRAHESGKKYLLHMDLAKGVGKDESGIRFLKRIGVDGIISTKVNIIKMAREQGLYTVQRFFIVDSHSLSTTVESVKASRPDMIELMPGTLTKVIARLKKCIEVPIIAGGLIETESEVDEILECGAAAVSTAKTELWELK